MTHERHTWLLQRLKPERSPSDASDIQSAVSDGKLDFEAFKKQRRNHWHYDYMGSSEFEWGAIPKALRAMAALELKSFQFRLSLASVAKPMLLEDGCAIPDPGGALPVYAIAQPELLDYVVQTVHKVAANDIRLKENARLHNVIYDLVSEQRPKFTETTRGWFDLDNLFFFFLDRSMFEATCRLLGVPCS